jgi:hypothetical protein
VFAIRKVLKQVETQLKQLQLNLEAAVDPIHKLLSSLRTYRDAYHRTANVVRDVLEQRDRAKERARQ